MTSQRIRRPGGETRLIQDDPALTKRLAEFGVSSPDLYIPGFRVSYRELDGVCRAMQNEGWSGLIGLDEAVLAILRRVR